MSDTICDDPSGNPLQQTTSHDNDISMVLTDNFDKLNLVASVCIIHGCVTNDIKVLCDNVATNCVSSHRSENKSSEDLQIYLKEIKNLEDENNAMKKKIEELDKRQEVLRKVIKDQETTFKMKNEIANRRESQRDTNES